MKIQMITGNEKSGCSDKTGKFIIRTMTLMESAIRWGAVKMSDGRLVSFSSQSQAEQHCDDLKLQSTGGPYTRFWVEPEGLWSDHEWVA